MLAAVLAEARAALVGDREDSTANRMTQPDRFGSHDTDRATTARLSLAVVGVGDTPASAPLNPGALASGWRARARQPFNNSSTRTR